MRRSCETCQERQNASEAGPDCMRCNSTRAEGAAQEREACALAAEKYALQYGVLRSLKATYAAHAAHDVAEIIRARGGVPLDAFNAALLANPKFQALKAATHAPKCQTCGGTGNVMERNGIVDELELLPCPDCAPKPKGE